MENEQNQEPSPHTQNVFFFVIFLKREENDLPERGLVTVESLAKRDLNPAIELLFVSRIMINTFYKNGTYNKKVNEMGFVYEVKKNENF